MRATVSAIIPTYNHGQYVVDAVESALSQTVACAEVIVVDDGSTDNTRERLSPYFGRIRYVFQENRGLSAARNVGIRSAHGDWVALLDADDVWHGDKLEVQLAAASRTQAVLLGGPSGDGSADMLEGFPRIEPLSVRDFLSWTPITPSSALIRRTCFDVVGFFDEALRSVEDRDMWLRIAARFDVARVAVPLFRYRLHEGQMNRNAKRMHENFERVLTAFFSSYPEYAPLERLGWAFLFRDSAISHMDCGRRGIALGYLLKSLILWPGAIDPRAGRRTRRLRLLVRLVLGERVFRALRKQGGPR